MAMQIPDRLGYVQTMDSEDLGSEVDQFKSKEPMHSLFNTSYQSFSFKIKDFKISHNKLCKCFLILVTLGLLIAIVGYFQIIDSQNNIITTPQFLKQITGQNCYKSDILRSYVFFISLDLEDMPKEQAQRFQIANQKCQFEVNGELAFNYYADIWNQLEENVIFNQSFINKKDLNREEKKLLLIWLRLYFRAGIYIHPSLGVNFGKYINDQYLLYSQVGKQVLYAKHDRKNQKGIFEPDKKFKTVKVGLKLSEYVRKIIQKIISKENWMELCEQYQCIIIKNAITFP